MHPDHAGDPRGYELAIDEARRALDGQDAQIKRQRDRAVTLLGFGGLAATFLTGVASATGSHATVWAWLAASVFVVQAVLTVIILWPVPQAPGMSAAIMVEIADREDVAYVDIARHIANELSTSYDRNNEPRERLTHLTTASLVCFVFILAALVLDLIVR